MTENMQYTQVIGETPPRGVPVSFIKVVSGPPPPTLMEYYVWEPLEYLVWKFYQISFCLMGIAILYDLWQ